MNSSYELKQNIIKKEIELQTVLVDINTAKYFTFNDTGNFLLNHIISGKSYDEISNDMKVEFELNDETLKKDYKNFLQGLIEKNLLNKREKKFL
ncbi:MAG: PqqD family protein [Desulfobacterales bacterium]|nr:PqqD family protein [Desulfobacterales bacterium]